MKPLVIVLFAVVVSYSAPAEGDTIPTPAPHTTSTINGTAFSGVAGIVHVNVASGVGNLQLNAVAIGMSAVPDTILATQTVGSGVAKALPHQSDRATIGPGAFKGAGGILQVNQSAGNGNASQNTLTLHIAP